jgi:ABC-type multidrug transport system permease subunit
VRPALVELTLARFREFLREPEAVFWVFVFPLLLAAGLGIAFRSRPPEVQPIGVMAPGGSAADARLIDALRADRRISVTANLDDSAAARLLRTGKVALVAVLHGDSAVEYHYDATRPESQSARLLADAALQSGAGRRDPLATSDRTVSAPGSRYIDFVVPGLLGMNLMGSGIWGFGFAIVDARRKKLLKRLIATPMSRAEYLMSFLNQRLVLLVFEVAALLGFGMLVFGVPMRGSWLVLALTCLLGALAFGGIGLLIASRAKTMEGASGLMNLVMLPMWVFSGVFFSASRFPDAAQPIIRALPLTAVVDALRATMIEGAGLAAIAGQLAIIAAWMVVTFLVALRIFRWR